VGLRSTRGGGPREPVRIRLGEERHAIALAHELVGLTRLDLRRETGCWEVAVGGAESGRLLVRVLDAVRGVLAGQPSASALVLLDGHEYRMQGE
jgi:hypothetical protein